MTSLEKALMCFAWLMAVPTLFLLCLFVGWRLVTLWQMLLRSGRCRECGCTEKDCTECVLATGEPCFWIDADHTLCSRCVDHLDASDMATHRKDLLSPDCPSLNAGRRR